MTTLPLEMQRRFCQPPSGWKCRHLQEEGAQTSFIEFKASEPSLQEWGLLRHIALASLSCLKSFRSQKSGRIMNSHSKVVCYASTDDNTYEYCSHWWHLLEAYVPEQESFESISWKSCHIQSVRTLEEIGCTKWNFSLYFSTSMWITGKLSHLK